ncbi:hypothetical protein FRC03_010565 [Tulasnella sp. 419]|nr:hypothetical protein FRC03_010565 [Tulasnella sp. 419]
MTSLIQQSLAIPHAVADIARDRAISALDTSANVVEKIHNIYSGVPTRTEKEIELGLNEYQSGIAKELAGLRDQLKRGFPITLSLEKAAALVDALIADKTGKGLDDRLMLVGVSRMIPNVVMTTLLF